MVATIIATPDSAGGYRQAQAAGITRIDADRMDARPVVTTAEPALALGPIPKRTHDLPTGTGIIGAKQAARYRTGPPPPGFGRTAGRQRPDQLERGRHWRLAIAGRHLVIRHVRRHRNLRPASALVHRALQLRAEVVKIERAIPAAIARIDQAQRQLVAKEGRARDAPSAIAAFDHEQTVAGGHKDRVRHSASRQCLQHLQFGMFTQRLVESVLASASY